MSELPRYGVATILASIPISGYFGLDKFYVGAKSMGILQTVLSLSFFGLLFTIPYSHFSAIMLCITIFSGGLPFLYPKVSWAPVTTFDKVMGIICIIGNLFIFINYYLNYMKKVPAKNRR